MGEILHVPNSFNWDILGIQQTYKVTGPNRDFEVIWVVVPKGRKDTKLQTKLLQDQF